MDLSRSSFPEVAAAQEKALPLLARGASISDVAASLGLYRSTVYSWIKSDDEFRLAYLRGQAEYTLTLRDDMRELSEMAMRTLMGILTDPLASPSIRFKASQFILARREFPNKDAWATPVPLMEPEENLELTEDNPLIAEDYERLRRNTAHPAPPNDSTEFDTFPRKSVFEQPEPPFFGTAKMPPAREASAEREAADVEPAEEPPENAA